METSKPNNKLSIYAGPPMRKVLEGHEENRSGRINEICARYDEIVSSSMPAFTTNEWCAICDALNGTWIGEDHPVRYVWAEISDSLEMAEKWNIDVLNLAARLRDMSYPSTVAVVEIATRFWKTEPEEGEGYRGLLKRVGAKLLDA